MGNNKYSNVPSFNLLGTDIPTVLHDKHLGNIIGHDSFKETIDVKVYDLYQNVNLLLAQFPCVNIKTKYKLFKSYCMSLYGSQLWDYESTECEKIYTAW